MNKLKLSFIILFLMMTKGLSANDFSVENDDGITIYYTITSSTDKTVAVTYRGSSSSSYSYKGNVSIPETVSYGGITYSVTSIGNLAFHNCSGLTSIEIPNSVTSIGELVFTGCTNLTEVKVNCPNIGTWFEGMASIKKVRIGRSVQSIAKEAFQGCTGLKKVIVDDIASWCNISFGGYSSNPLYYAHHLYSDENTEIKKLVIPNSVTSIGQYTFFDCSGLAEIEIPNSVNNIGDYAFSGCSGLTDIEISNSVTSIGNDAFRGCNGLTDLVLNCKKIGGWFSGISSIKTVKIGSSVTSITNSAFSNCTGLEKVIAEDIASWCNISFDSYNSNPLCYAHHLYSDENIEITNLVIPKTVASIGKYTFYNCSSLTSVKIPNSVTSIGNSAFSGCSGLTSLVIPNSVTSIGESAFSDCVGLTDIEIPNSVTSIEHNTFFKCLGLTSIKIPNSIVTIGYSAFSGCTGLTSIEIPQSVTSIGSHAFYYCSSLTNVILGKSVSYIGEYAFYGCENIEEVVSFVRMIFNIDKNVFSNKTYLNATLYVPEGRKKAYEAATGWQNFVYIEEGVPAGIHDVLFDDSSDAVEVARYDSNGKIILAPTKGLNIIKYSNGKVKKVYVK